MKLLSSEWLKTRHTLIRWLIFFLPIFMSACIIIYLANRNSIAIDTIYQTYFIICSAILIPIETGILTGFYVQEEELAGNFNGVLSTGIPRRKIYVGKFVFLVVSLTISYALTTLIICIGLSIVLPQGFNTPLFLTASLLSLIGTLPILAIHLWISFAFGIGASVGVGILGILVAVLMGTTNLGNNIWYFLPWTYPVKMSMFPLALLAPSSQMIANKIIIQFILCISLSLVLSILFLLFGIIWFEKWEGRKNVE